MAKFKVSLRGGFSDRNGIKTENIEMQTTRFDVRTRVALWNATSIIINRKFDDFVYPNSRECQAFVKQFWADVYGQALDWKKYYNSDDLLKAIGETFQADDYDDVLTIVEYIVECVDESSPSGFMLQGRRYTAAQVYNGVFEREYVGYRIIGGKARPISDEQEVSSIKDAVVVAQKEVAQHIDKALGFLSNRESPDYANSIKESISAVERMCSLIIGKSTTLNDALKKLEDNGVVIHTALKGAFGKLYGYTSDASGIRHAGELGGADSTFEEAKFMLVSCCAFINYLTGVMAKER